MLTFSLSASSITVSLRRLKHFDCKEKQAFLVSEWLLVLL